MFSSAVTPGRPLSSQSYLCLCIVTFMYSVLLSYMSTYCIYAIYACQGVTVIFTFRLLSVTSLSTYTAEAVPCR